MLMIAVRRVRQLPTMKIARKKMKDLSSMKTVAQRVKQLVKLHPVLMALKLALSSYWHHPAYKQTSNPGRLVLPRIWQNVQEIYPS